MSVILDAHSPYEALQSDQARKAEEEQLRAAQILRAAQEIERSKVSDACFCQE